MNARSRALQLGVGEPAEQHPRAERQAADALVEVLAGPRDEARVDGLVECAHELRDRRRRS